MSMFEDDFDRHDNVSTLQMNKIYDYLIVNFNLCEKLSADVKKNNLNKEEIHNILSNTNTSFNPKKIMQNKKIKKNNEELFHYLDSTKFSNNEKNVVINSLVDLYKKENNEENIKNSLKSISNFYKKLRELDFYSASIYDKHENVDLNLKKEDCFLTDGKVESHRVEAYHGWGEDYNTLSIQLKNPTFILGKAKETGFLKELLTKQNNKENNCYYAFLFTNTPNLELLSNVSKEELFRNNVKEFQEFIEEENFEEFAKKYKILHYETKIFLRKVKEMSDSIKENHYENLLEGVENQEFSLDQNSDKLLKRLLTTNKITKDMIDKPKQYRLDNQNKQ